MSKLRDNEFLFEIFALVVIAIVVQTAYATVIRPQAEAIRAYDFVALNDASLFTLSPAGILGGKTSCVPVSDPSPSQPLPTRVLRNRLGNNVSEEHNCSIAIPDFAAPSNCHHSGRRSFKLTDSRTSRTISGRQRSRSSIRISMVRGLSAAVISRNSAAKR